ncbi:short-chain dehydrogenase TIC 32 B, chloroplastic [Impatiens glandulifera]|uniref:short-chain dehydrogenase TIC 32 B, chloroplastic n=1 Tax=Impatiens glandulifera TaxID=253017 RepID=UPI001FB051F5|nr:short-chain dehydrogenase TIC 32 B, chloroplastic [Impatiens glandulifera]
MKGTMKYLAGIAGPSGYGSKSTAEQVTADFSSFSYSPLLSPPPPLSPSHHHHHHPITAIVTGGTSGIGAETARVLAKRGVRVVIPARNMKKAVQVRDRILNENPQAQILLLKIDLSSLASVHTFSSHFLSLNLPLNILINNAGKFSQKLELSEDKIEMTIATNYLGHFVLTELLLEKMVETAEKSGIEGRIINVSSVIHTWVNPLHFSISNMLNPPTLRHNYNGTRAYAQSKLANILHAKELSRQLKERNARVTINAVHPGIVKTAIIRDHKGFITDSLYFLASKLLKSIPQGASTTCYVAVSKNTEGMSGKYFADCNESNCSTLANDEALAKLLFDNTQALLHRRLRHPPL